MSAETVREWIRVHPVLKAAQDAEERRSELLSKKVYGRGMLGDLRAMQL